MSSSVDTLDISPTKRFTAPPIAAVQREESLIHPQAAENARKRIAAIPELHPLTDSETVPAIPTAELVIDRNILAGQKDVVPLAKHVALPPIAKSALTGIGIFLSLLLLFKSPVILSQISYLSNKPAPTTSSVAPVVASSLIPADPTITIPKINIHAPTVYEPSIVEANVQKALEGGIVHYGNTPAPGQGGNAVYFGHSSNDWWEPGNFKFVFVLLDKLVPGDRFSIDYQSKRYTYEVTGSRIVLPTDLSVLTQTSEPTVSLITCTPPGTSWKRLVVSAKQVDPDPHSAPIYSAPPAKVVKTSLPGAAPGIFDQVGQAWSGVVHGISSLFGADGTRNAPGQSSHSPQSEPGGQLPIVK